MKSIDEGFEDHKSENQTLFRTSKVSFKSGIEFAERWIPVEEELPPCSDEDLLIKGLDLEWNDGIVDIGYMHDSPDGKPSVDNFISLGGVLIKITHWRPINHK